MSDDHHYMRHALELARRGFGRVSPNPAVGCVIVSDRKIVGEGWHAEFGGPHAEVAALEEAGDGAEGATVYLSLEPCCHDGPEKKTPPCAPELVGAKVSRVVIAIEDPNPEVSGKGIAALREAGINVEVGVLTEEAEYVNAPYFSLIRRGRPLVTAKWAMTADGKIATTSGDSRWISSPQARHMVHVERGCSDAVLVGIGTVLTDDPRLTARAGVGRQPLRVVLDRELDIPLASTLVKTAGEVPVLVYTSVKADESQGKELRAAGVEVVSIETNDDNYLDWNSILEDLGKRKISSLIVEGGGGVMTTVFEHCAADRVMVFIAPKIIGGTSATTPVGGAGAELISHGINIEDISVQPVGVDVLMQGRVVYPSA